MRKIKKVLLIGTIPPPIGGDAIWMLNYMSFLKENDIDFSFVDTSLVGKRAQNVSSNYSIISEIKRTISIKKNIKKLLKSSIYDAVHMNINCSPLGTIRDYFNARRIIKINTNLVLHCHCNIEDQIGKRKIFLHFLKKLLKLSKAVIVLNESSYNFASKICPKNNKITLIPNFLNDDEIIKNKKTINSKIKNVLFIGHVKREKGIDEYLNASAFFPDYNFLICGKLSDKYTEQEFDKYGNVNYLGELEHKKVISEIDNSDLFIFPTYTEGFSLALLEAMSRGVPIIATDVGANKEMLGKNNKCGIIIPPKNTQCIINAINAMKEENIRKLYSEKAIERVKKLYSKSVVCNKILDLY